MKPFAAGFGLFVLLPLAVHAGQDPASTTLRERAGRVTAQLQEDAARMHDFRDALLFARLAEAWKPADPQRSRDFLEQAVQIVSASDKTESEERLAERLTIGGRLLPIVGGVDPKLGLQLAHSLADRSADISRQNASPKLLMAREWVCDSLRELEASLPAGDLAGRVSLVDDLIRLHNGNTAPVAILDFTDSDPEVADDLYRKAAATARADFDYDMLFGLVQVPFPYVGGANPLHGVTPGMKSEAAGLVAAFMLRPMDTPEQRQDVCRAAALAARVLPSLPPDVASPVASAVEACKSTPTPDSTAFSDTAQEPDTVEDALRLAENTGDVKLRARYKLDAARIADQRDPLRAIDILADMTDDERTAAGGSFPMQWLMHASPAVYALSKRHDAQAVQRILDAAPDQYRANLTIRYALDLIQDDPQLSRLEAGEALRCIARYPPDDDRTYAMLLRLYSEAAPEDALLALRTVVKGLNDFRQMTDEEFRRKGYRPAYLSETMEPLRGAGGILLRLDEGTADAVVRELDSPDYRSLFRLGLLYALLEKHDPVPGPRPKSAATKPVAKPK